MKESARSDLFRLHDILESAEVIAQYLPADRTEFDQNPPLQSHIYRYLMIIGEAAWRLSKELKQRYPKVPWPQIEGMRHIMVHDYFKVDWDIVFNTAKIDVPAFSVLVQAILSDPERH